MHILFDIGGTNMRLAGSRDGVLFGEMVKVKTPEDFGEGIRLFIETAREIAGAEKIDAIAGGIAGSFDAAKAALWRSPNISGWEGKPLKKRFEEEFGVPVFLENDAALAGLGEAVAGAGKDHAIVGYITVGTGVGGVRIVDGTIDRNAVGFEPGHQIVSFDRGENFGLGGVGDLESCISGSAFEKRYGKKPYEVTEESAWEEAARVLAVGLYNVAVLWSPDAIVLGGSMIVGNPAIELERVQEYFSKILKIFETLPVLLKAHLGDVGGLSGALALLKSELIRIE